MEPRVLQQTYCPKNAIGSFKIFKWSSLLLLIAIIFSSQVNAQAVVDATSMNHKIMAGYQGWFRVPGDRPGSRSWAHVFNGNAPAPERLALDTWPDMSELTPEEKVVIPGWNFPDGSPATMYSAQNPKTVLRHFQWMKQYGIDGVWLSEFCGSFRNGRPDSAMYTIMKNVQVAARKTGRTWAFMWDMTSFNGSTSKEVVQNTLINYWKKMVDDGVTTDPRYMHDHGKPVLLIWGFFANRPASQPSYMNPVLDFMLAPGKYQATMIAGADNKWRQGTPEFVAMLMRMQGLQPWTVGRRIRNPNTGYQTPYTDEWAGDIAMCKAHGVTFMPVINSGTHIAGPPPIPPALPYVPRRHGNYLWQQFIAASKTGAISSAFVAMFDEVNEGTQIMKVTSKPPVQAQFLTYDGATNDYYLRLVGEGAKYMRSGKPVPLAIPISPFDAKKWYKIKNNASGLMLSNQSKTAKESIVVADTKTGANDEWQLVYLFDGSNGYFKIKSKLSGKVLYSTSDGALSQAADVPSDYIKWHFESDGTGNVRIINKVSGKALSSSGSTAGAPVMAVADPKKPADLTSRDDLRWRIIEQ